MGDAYDDKLETMLVTRQRVAEKRRVSRQQELQKRIAIAIIVLTGLVLFVVLVSKGCSSGSESTDSIPETTPEKITFASEVTTAPEETTTLGFANMYTLDVLNFRAEPSTDAEILLQIPLGEKVKVLSNEGDWVRIKYSGKKGYVMLEYLSETDPDAETTASVDAETTEEVPTSEMTSE